MDTVAVSSSFCVRTPLARERPPTGLSTNKRHHLHLAAFLLKTHPFSCNPSSPRHALPTKGNRPRSFLPRLVASMEQVEETYIMVKPDGVQRGLSPGDCLKVGEVISRFERKGFKLTGLKLFQCPRELAEEHYKDLQSKPFFPKLIDYITSGPVDCMDQQTLFKRSLGQFGGIWQFKMGGTLSMAVTVLRIESVKLLSGLKKARYVKGHLLKHHG